jgi:octaprenyl-diphosphate synthase
MRGVSGSEDIVRASATHLLELGGKRLRPLCVVLASRVGAGFDRRALDLAVAVELVHTATLLHDDVVDMGDMRRGRPTARTIFGNAASIFAGDHLLIEALGRVTRARVPATLERLLEIIDEMIRAEAIQLERRGRLDVDRATWLAIVEGKTAALFRWAMFAGARAGGLDGAACEALEGYGLDLGVAFQAVDDVLDLAGDRAATGKALFTDVREGKMTWPLIIAIEREPALRRVVAEIAAAGPDEEIDAALARELVSALERTGAIADSIALAHTRAERAVRRLDALPDGPATRALATVAATAVDRRQ